jgi:hypothetical protein
LEVEGNNMAEPPPDLAALKLPQWVRQHHPRSYDQEILDPPSEREQDVTMLKSMGKVAWYTVRGGISPVGWVSLGWDVVKGLARHEVMRNLPALRKEAQREDFRNLMWEKFWTNEALYDSSATREAAFDALVGDNAGHGIVPALTQQAEVKRSELMDRVNDRWLDKLERGSELVGDLEFYEQMKPGPDADKSAHQDWNAMVESKQKELDSFNAAMAAEAVQDIQLVKDFESNPSNWDLTPDQQSMLTSKMEPQEGDQRSDDDAFYDVVGGRPD